MKTITRLSIFLIAIPILIAQCENENEPDISEIKSGQISIEMNLKSMSDEVMQIKGSLHRPHFDTIQVDFIIEEQMATAFLEAIPVGIWTVKIDAYNSYGEIIYSGSSQVEVLVGKVIPIYIHLYKTGSIEVTVTWGEKNELVAYYPFNGSAYDESGNLNHGIVNGATLTTDRFGNAKSAYYFDGIDDYILIKHSPYFDFSKTKQISFGAWVNFEGTEGGCIIGKDSPCGYFAYACGIYPDYNFGGSIHSFECWLDSKTSEVIDLYEWNHLFFTADNHSIKNYLNGIMVKEDDLYNVQWNSYTHDTNIGVWGGEFPLESFFKGKIDDVIIYNKILNETEIERLYKEGKVCLE